MAQENRTSFKLPNDLRDFLKEEAEKQNRSLANLIVTILKEYKERVQDSRP